MLKIQINPLGVGTEHWACPRVGGGLKEVKRTTERILKRGKIKNPE
jgi:hypothetical protein